AIVRALAGTAGKSIVVPAGCRLLVGGPAAGGATFTLPSGTTIRCDNHDAGFVLARRACDGGTAPGAACDADHACPGAARCVADGGLAPFAPDAAATYTLFRAAAGASDVRIVGCGIFANQLEPFGRCVDGSGGGIPCTLERGCPGGGTCTGAPLAPAGPGRIAVVDLAPAVDGTIESVWVRDHARGTSFAGGDRIERCRNDLRSPADPAVAAFARFALAAVEVGSGAVVRGNRLVASTHAIAAHGSFVTVSENRVGEARGLSLPDADPVTGIYLDGGQLIVTHNHVTTFNCVRGSAAASNVTVAENRCFSGAGAKVVVTGPGWSVTGNYLAWGSGAAVCVGGPRRSTTCARNADCPAGACAKDAPVLAIGDDGTPGWTAGGTRAGADHPVIANNILYSDAAGATLIAFASPGVRLANGNIVGNLLLGGGAGPRVGIDLGGVGIGTSVVGWLVGSNHLQSLAIGLRFPTGEGANAVSDVHVLPNAYTRVAQRMVGWAPRMGDADATALADRPTH
ncbi:MAG: hypothetical protein ACREQL_10685, partial [Candidatus Binatia bacterium]